MDLNRDFAKLTEKLKSSRAVEIPIKSRGTEQEAFIHGMVAKSLSYVKQVHLESTLHMIVAELLSNAEKAVLKKLYYKDLKVEPTQATGEQKENFKNEYRNNIVSLRALAKKLKFIAVFRIQINDNKLELSVENEGSADANESKRIRENMILGAQHNNLNSLNDQKLDKEEGNGAGLVLSLVALRKADIPPESLTFRNEGGKSIFQLILHSQDNVPDKLAQAGNGLLSEVDSLPAFPDNLRKMMELCESEKSDAKQLSSEIEKDPAIAGQIIKLANSGGFAGGKISSLVDAVKIIGIKAISGLLLRVGAFTILEERYDITEEIMEHPVRVAFYSRKLARQFKLSAMGDQVFAGGLLHDIGKIVLLESMQHRDNFDSLVEGRDRRSQINLEELACGISHAVLGGILARKWNFPEDLCSTIEFHHTPQEAPAELKKLVYLVYLANSIADYQSGNLTFFAVEPDVLAFFNLTNPDSFEMLASTLNTAFLNAK